MEYFKSLPEEITINILSRIPTESVLDCKLVYTYWNNLVSHYPSFSKMHLYHLNHPSNAADSGKLSFLASTEIGNDKEIFYYFEYDENHEPTATPVHRIRRTNLTLPSNNYSFFVGSLNGLICVSLDPSPCICNPITKQYVMLPETKTDCCDIERYTYFAYSFGYVSSTDEYKVFEIQMSLTNIKVHIYTLGCGKGWRKLGKFSYASGSRTYHWEKSGIFANEALHWLDGKLNMIVKFDLAEEKFCEHIPPPPEPPHSCYPEYGYWFNARIGVLDGLLFFAIGQDNEEGGFNDIWVLRKKNDNHDMKERGECQSLGWSKEFKVDDSKLLAITKSHGVLTFVDNYLNIYDTKALTSKRLVDFKVNRSHIFAHRNTLVCLKELGEQCSQLKEAEIRD